MPGLIYFSIPPIVGDFGPVPLNSCWGYFPFLKNLFTCL